MSEEITPAETTPESAFQNAIGGHEFDGAPLRPFSRSRSKAARVMGLRWPFIGESALDQFRETNMYPHAPSDTAIVLWLCSLPDQDEITAALRSRDKSAENAIGKWSPERAYSHPPAALVEANKWAEQNELCDPFLTSERFIRAFQTMLVIVNEESQSRFTVEVEKTSGESGDESGKV
jgi:hypothetical protein